MKPGIDIHNESGAPRRLWEATLRYVGSVPGCCAIEWGSRLDNHPSGPTSIICLIHWDSTAAWRNFQYSSGFTPIIMLLDSDVSNRCAKLGPSGASMFSCGADTQEKPTVVDIVSVTMPAEDVSTPEHQYIFEEAWKMHVVSVTDGHESLQFSYATWLENNASTFFEPTPAEAAAATKQAVFMAFLVWDQARYDSCPAKELCDRLRSSLPPSHANGPTTVTRKAVQLINQTPQREGYNSVLQQPPAEHVSLVSILNAGFPRLCSADLANLGQHARQAITRSISDARAKARLFPAPQAMFESQGDLYEGHTPVIRDWQHPASFHGGYHYVDVVWMQLKARAPKSQGFRIYNELKDQMSALTGFVKAFWARDAEHKRKVAVLTGQKITNQSMAVASSSLVLRLLTCAIVLVWEDEATRGAASQDYRRILDGFAASSVHLIGPLKHQPFFRTRGAPRFNDWRTPYLELICFRVPTGVVERRLFEHAYGAFAEFVIFLPPLLLQELVGVLLVIHTN